MSHKRMYILDTNVLMYDPACLNSFEGSLVGIPLIVLEELDKFKIEGTSDKGYNAREVIRQLDALRVKGELAQGVPLDNGGTLQVLFLPEKGAQFPSYLKMDRADNEILCTALTYKDQGYDVQFISKDLNARIKADVLGIPSQDYQKGKVSEREVYKGWISISVPAVQLKKEFPEELDEIIEQYDLPLNAFILVQSNNNPYNYKIFRYVGRQRFRHVDQPTLKWPLGARNPQQLMALDLLLDPEIELVSLIGQAGTGKTFMALLAGLHQVLVTDDYRRMLVSRPIVPLGPDIGFLPGSLEEKLHSWMQPIYDNMEFIVHSSRKQDELAHLQERAAVRHHKKGKEHKQKRERLSLEELIKEEKVGLEAITYMRGRSIPYQYILIDEVQNLTPHEVKTIISRVGEGSKLILCGDPYQIDSPYLDFSSNGLVVASSRFEGQHLFGTVFLDTSERSELSKLANELL